jgi:hypothetical protein
VILAGLPPKISNQEYNCHFLCTSNTAGALEMGKMVVDELKYTFLLLIQLILCFFVHLFENLLCLSCLSSQGFPAYDIGIGEDVLVMTVVLAFLADSPMHAEITNTPVPLVSLNPCRFCELSSDSTKAKNTILYIQKCLAISGHGLKAKHNL